MMTRTSNITVLLSGLSPWIILGAVLVLLPIVAMMTMANINRQKAQSIRLMTEKGAALIRSFEAGTRMGMRGGHGRGFQLQRLLVETAAQPDIAYLVVVRGDGSVIAHSQSERLGSRYGLDLDLEAVYQSDALAWRSRVDTQGAAIFELFGKFAPLPGPARRPMHRHMTGAIPKNGHDADPPPMVIFVGMRTDSVDAARAADTRQTIVMAAVLLLVGCAGVLLLFMAQNYRSARSSLVRAQAFSDNLVARIPIGLVAVDLQGRITAVNSVAETILGITAAAVTGRDAGSVIPLILADTLAEAEDPVQREVDCPMADGRSIPMDISAASLSDEDGQCFGQVILFKDLTEIRTLHQELEHNRRLASVGRLAAGVAHEIRNPLSSIKGFATYFKEKYRGVQKDQEIAGILIQEVDRLNRVVGQLLDFSRPIRLQSQQVPLKPLVEDAFRLVDRQSRDNSVSLTLEMSDENLTAVFDRDKMSQVMLNLLLNAVDAMPGGGRLTVRAEAGEGGAIRIQVVDNGVGIDPADQAHMFEPYFSTKPSGTGLGLAIVHNVVQAHRGEIRVDSRPGEGTTVHITLPAAQET
jgi:two-component system sensor histidine kinase HydH